MLLEGCSTDKAIELSDFPTSLFESIEVASFWSNGWSMSGFLSVSAFSTSRYTKPLIFRVWIAKPMASILVPSTNISWILPRAKALFRSLGGASNLAYNCEDDSNTWHEGKNSAEAFYIVLVRSLSGNEVGNGRMFWKAVRGICTSDLELLALRQPWN